MWRKLDIDPALVWRHSVAAGTRFKVTRTSGSVQGDSQEVDTNLRWVHSIRDTASFGINEQTHYTMIHNHF